MHGISLSGTGAYQAPRLAKLLRRGWRYPGVPQSARFIGGFGGGRFRDPQSKSTRGRIVHRTGVGVTTASP